MSRTLIFAGIGLVFIMATYLWEWLRSRRKASPAELMEALRRSPQFQQTVSRIQNANRWEVQISISNAAALTPERLAEIASAAFGRLFVVRTGEFDAIDAAFLPDEQGDAQIAGSSPHFYVALAPYLFEVLDIARGDGRLRTFNYTPSAGHVEELENGFRWTGKLAAQSLAGESVSVRLNGTSFPSLSTAVASAALRCDDPLTALRSAAGV